MEQKMNKEDFKVGDRILDTYLKISGEIIEITSRGFKYKLDERVNLGARIGWYQEGEVFEDGLKDWKKL